MRLPAVILSLALLFPTGSCERREPAGPASAPPPSSKAAVVSLDAVSAGELAALRAENKELRQGLARLRQHPVHAQPDANRQTAPLSTPVETPSASQLYGTFADPESPPPRDQPLNDRQYQRLLSGEVLFQPGSIPSSGVPVTDQTPLVIGQDVQLKWGSTWWAATITGFEEDGAVRAHYFGWNDSHDEAVPRSDLQLDSQPRDKAIRAAYPLTPPADNP